MDVVFAIRRNIEVYHQVNVWNVQASAGNVSSYQDVSISRLEFVQGREPLLLAQLSIDVDRFEVKIP